MIARLECNSFFQFQRSFWYQINLVTLSLLWRQMDIWSSFHYGQNFASLVSFKAGCYCEWLIKTVFWKLSFIKLNLKTDVSKSSPEVELRWLKKNSGWLIATPHTNRIWDTQPLFDFLCWHTEFVNTVPWAWKWGFLLLSVTGWWYQQMQKKYIDRRYFRFCGRISNSHI